MQGSADADRIAALHVPVIQLNTDAGFGGECHLDANMVRSAIPELPLDEIDLLVIENVGNLVCPAEFRVGEDARVMVCSVDRGRGQAAQVPADVPRLRAGRWSTRSTSSPHLDFDLDRFLANLDAVHPGVERIAGQRAHRRGGRRAGDWLAARRPSGRSADR